MTLDVVLERFLVIADIDDENSAMWIPICSESIYEIKSKLKKDVSEEQNAGRLEAAAAVLTLYEYALYSSVVTGAESFSAGEFKLKADTKTSVEIARKAWQEAKNSIAELLEDENFVFERIPFND